MPDRRAKRSSVLLTATVEVAGGRVPVKLRNVSVGGALVEADRLPLRGLTTYFARNELRLKGRVVWVQSGYAGLAFDEGIDPSQLLRNIPAPKLKVEVRFTRPGLACRPLSDRELRMVERWMDLPPMWSPAT